MTDLIEFSPFALQYIATAALGVWAARPPTASSQPRPLRLVGWILLVFGAVASLADGVFLTAWLASRCPVLDPLSNWGGTLIGLLFIGLGFFATAAGFGALLGAHALIRWRRERTRDTRL